MDHASLVAAVKNLQRSSPQAKDQWNTFATMRGGSCRDPAKHDVGLLQEFLQQIEAGQMLPVDPTLRDKTDPEVHVVLAQGVQALVQRTPLFQQAWAQFCAANAGGQDDPNAHDNDYMFNFFNALAACNAANGGFTAPVGGAMGGIMAGTKRMRTAMGMPVEMDLLISRLKSFLRSSEENKELWGLYADQYLAGVRDPTRHDASIIKEFCDNHEVPELDGTMPMPTEACQAAQAGGMWGEAGAGGNAHLANRVRAFVKMGAENQELWGLYADTYLNGRRDPLKHDAAILQEFCLNHGVPEMGAGLSGGMAGGMGGAGRMPGMGGGQANVSPKQVLVDKVNCFRAIGAENEAVWVQCAGPQAGDPEGVMFFKLQEFCTTWGL